MKLRLAIWFLLLTGISALGMGNNGVPPWFGARVATAFPLAGMTALWSTRKVISTYAGKALQVTRQSDSTTQDIGFVAGNLDNTSLLSFCAATTCRVNIWYSQDGVSAHDANAAFSNPFIVQSGTITSAMNLQTCVDYPSMGQVGIAVPAASTAISVTSGTILAVGNARTTPSGGSATGSANANMVTDFGASTFGLAFAQTTFSGAPAMVGWRQDSTSTERDTAGVSYTFNTNGIFGWRFSTTDSPTLKAYVRGGTPGTNSNTNTLATPTFSQKIGFGFGTFTKQFDGYTCEAVSYSSELNLGDTNATAQNMAAYWGQTWTNITQ